MSKIKNSVGTSAPLVSFSEAIENVSNKVSQSIVSVRSENRGIGSGIVWDSDGHIVTCSQYSREDRESKSWS